jgi:amino acid transporter
MSRQQQNNGHSLVAIVFSVLGGLFIRVVRPASRNLAGRSPLRLLIVVVLSLAWPVALYGTAFYLFGWWGLAYAAVFAVVLGQILRRVARRLAVRRVGGAR